MTGARTLLICLIVLALSGVASAQTTFYGTLKCDNASANDRDKANPSGKSGNAAAAVTQEKCTWALPLMIGTDVAQDGTNSITSTVSGATSKDTGTHAGRMLNSDQFVLTLTGTSVVNSSGEVRSRQGTWTFASGTGLLKGITGSGTYSANPRAQGGMSYDVEGEYDLPGTTPAPATAPAQGTTPPAGNPPASNTPGQGNSAPQGKPTS